jgi:hypothetical protein
VVGAYSRLQTCDRNLGNSSKHSPSDLVRWWLCACQMLEPCPHHCSRRARQTVLLRLMHATFHACLGELSKQLFIFGVPQSRPGTVACPSWSCILPFCFTYDPTPCLLHPLQYVVELINTHCPACFSFRALSTSCRDPCILRPLLLKSYLIPLLHSSPC